MGTLSDVNTLKDENAVYYAGLSSGVFPEARSLQTGVSVRCVQELGKQWFVLRATYGRVGKAYDFITEDHTDVYIPMHYVERLVNGKKKRILEPMLPSLLFVYATKEKVETYIKQTPALSFLNYYYDHFKVGADGKNPPLTVGFDEMMNFIRLTSVDNEHIKVVQSNLCRYKSGDRVRIMEGDFEGIEGRVARVAGQQRVVIEIEGLCTIATAYIPSAFLKVI